MKKRRWIRFAIAFSLFSFLLFLIAPCNEIDNALPWKQAEMNRITLEWGQLASFPQNAQNFKIWTEGGPFTRTFRGTFIASPDAVQDWLQMSNGVTKGKAQTNADGSVHYELKTSGGASYGEVDIAPDGSTVKFRVSWS